METSRHLCLGFHKHNPAKIRRNSHSTASVYPQETFLLASKPHGSSQFQYSVGCITQVSHTQVKTEICRMSHLLQSHRSVWVESLHVCLQRSTVAKLLLTNLTHECLDARVLHKMSLQVVRRCKPPPTVLTVIGVVALVNSHVQLQPEVRREGFATFTTTTSHASGITWHDNWHWVHARSLMCLCHHCLENKHSLVRCSCLARFDDGIQKIS